MISEIKGKISTSGSNLTDRLEDKLTGDFFGTLRYLPFEQGLQGILEQVEFLDEMQQKLWQAFLAAQTGFEVEYDFWPRHIKGEIDLLLEFKDFLVGIEVKYKSGISSEDDSGKVIDYDKSTHQLSKYSYMIEERAGNKKGYLIFLAPFHIQNTVQKQYDIKYKISPDVTMGFANWEDLHTKLGRMKKSAQAGTQKLILTDAEELLEVKSLKRFTGFLNGSGETIEHDPYQYQKDKIQNKKAWIWPAQQLEQEEKTYVYRSN